MITNLPVKEFLTASEDELVLDVRTPAEYTQGHILQAENLPLFNNEERALIGTCYKQKGRQPAILLGFELIGPRWSEYIREVEKKLRKRKSSGGKVFVHCWRGGMRSGAMAWALSFYGFDVCLLTGGYKTYRHYCLDTFEQEFPLIILSGKTGCAKTATLQAMKEAGEQVVDLEDLAQHQGSSFGSKGYLLQPTQEQFENMLAIELRKMNPEKRIWMENESASIGKRVIPKQLFNQMRVTQIIDMQIPLEERIQFLNSEYGVLPQDFLIESVQKITQRLGPNETKICLQAIAENRMNDFIRQALVYYDKTYQRGQEQRSISCVHALPLNTINPTQNAEAVIALCNHLYGSDISLFKQGISINEHN